MRYAGYFDFITNDAVQGWAFNVDDPDQRLYVDIYISGNLTATVPASLYREDLRLNGIGDGCYSFSYKLPRRLVDDQLHIISVMISGTSVQLGNSPKFYPADPLILRMEAAKKYLKGKGIEVGALHKPLPIHHIPDIKEMKYVDRYSVSDLRKHYPELNQFNLVNVDIIDDGERLGTIRDGSLDFIICNHMLEHCENPIGTLRNHIKKLNPGGKLFITIPDKRYTFDKDRELTSFAHLLQDDQEGPAISREEHYMDWVVNVRKIEGETNIQETYKSLLETNYSIHFHVWDEYSFKEFLQSTRTYLNNAFEISFFQPNCQHEVVTVLTKL